MIENNTSAPSSPSNIKAMQNFLEPEITKHLQFYLGPVNDFFLKNGVFYNPVQDHELLVI